MWPLYRVHVLLSGLPWHCEAEYAAQSTSRTISTKKVKRSTSAVVKTFSISSNSLLTHPVKSHTFHFLAYSVPRSPCVPIDTREHHTAPLGTNEES